MTNRYYIMSAYKPLPRIYSSLFYILISLQFIITSEWYNLQSSSISVVYAHEEVENNNNDEDERILQNSNNICKQSSLQTPSSTKTINQVLNYLDDHRLQIEESIFIRYTNHHQNETVPTTQFTYKDFRSSLEWMATVGVDKGNGEKWKFYMGPENCNGDGWHIGLANVATFLSQSMSLVILNDTW